MAFIFIIISGNTMFRHSGPIFLLLILLHILRIECREFINKFGTLKYAR